MEEARSFELVFVRRGLFAVETRDGEHLLTPNEVWVLPPAIPYRIRHPRGGDTCTILTIPEAVLADYTSSRQPMRAHRASNRLALIHARLRFHDPAPLEAEELVRETLEEVSASAPLRDLTPHQRRLARFVQELLAARVADKLTLATIAGETGSSSFHLTRIFRRATGRSIHEYQTHLRLRTALEMLSGGVDDLSRVALDLGFYDQSHFTNAFRRGFGGPPSSFRRRVTRGRKPPSAR